MSIWQRFNGVYAVPMTLAGICMMLTGQPGWTAEAARAHMAAELARAPRQSWLWPARALIRESVIGGWIFGAGVCLAMAIVAVLIFVVGCIALAFVGLAALLLGTEVSPQASNLIGYALLYCGVGFVCGGTLALPAFALMKLTIRGPAVWKEYSYATYKLSSALGPLPEVVRVGVDSILEALPHARATVFVLEQDGYFIDPVAEISCLNPTTGEFEKVYPFVWDEHGTILSPPR